MTEAATFHLEMTRQIRAPRERVFDAFTDQAALAVWHCRAACRCGKPAPMRAWAAVIGW